jgi:flagellar hook-associated protein 3 FlgL
MLAGLDAYTPTFLSNVNAAETRINTANEELSSGYRINQPSDDPGAIVAILGYQSQIDNVTQVQSNLAQATTIANVSDAALTSAGDLLNQLASIAAQGSGSSATAADNNALAEQVQGIGEQMVALANTTFSGAYVFGGDDSNIQPYTSNFSANPFVAPGYVQNNTAGATVTLTNSDGDTIAIPAQTAQQIFDTQTAAGAPAAGNILQNISALVQALQSNNQTNIQASAASITASVTQLAQATTISGNTLDWLQTSTTAATAKLTDFQSQISGLRDADATQAATDLTTAQTAMQAAIAAQGTMNIKTLFSYLG